MNDNNEKILCMSFDTEVSCNQSEQSVSDTMTNIRPSKLKRDDFDKMSGVTIEKLPSEVEVQTKGSKEASVETSNRTRQKQFQEGSVSEKDYQPKPPIRFISSWNIEASNNTNTRSRSETAVVKDTSKYRLEQSGAHVPADKKERRQITKASEDDGKVRQRSECDKPSKQSKTGKVEKVSKERPRKSHSGDDNDEQVLSSKVVKEEQKSSADNVSKKEKRKEGKSRSSTKTSSHKSRNDILFDEEVSTFLELLECTSSESGVDNVKRISTVKENIEDSKKSKKDDNKIKHSTKGSSYSSPRKRQGEAAVERDLSNFLQLLETSAAGVTSMEVLNPSTVEESSESRKDEKKKVNVNHSCNKKKSCSEESTKQSAGRSQSKSSDRLDLELGTTESHDSSPRQGDKISSKNDKKRESSKKSKDVSKDTSPKQSKSKNYDNQDTLKTPLGKKNGVSSLNHFMTSNKINEISVVSDEQSVRSRRTNLAAWREMTKSRSETDGVRKSATMRGGKKEKIEKKDDNYNDDDDDKNSASNDDDDDDENSETDDMNESVLKDDERKRILNESMKGPVRAMSIRSCSAELSKNNTASLLAGLPSDDDMDDDSSRGGYLPTGFGKGGGAVGQQQNCATSSDKDRALARRPSLICAASFSDFSDTSDNNNNHNSFSSLRGTNEMKLNSSLSNDASSSRIHSPEKLLRNSLVKDKSTATILASFSPTKTAKGTSTGTSSPSKLSTRMGTAENDDALQNILKSRRLRGDDVANHRAIRNEENTKRKSRKFSFV